MTTSPSPWDGAPQPQRGGPHRRSNAFAIGGTIFFVLLMGLYVALTCRDPMRSSGSVMTSRPDHSPDLAWAMAQQFVDRQLKAPSQASYGGRSVRKTGSAQYDVRGWVDAPNELGVRLRYAFTITVRYDGGETWTAVKGPALAPNGGSL